VIHGILSEISGESYYYSVYELECVLSIHSS
jgi:hypothetical protein